MLEVVLEFCEPVELCRLQHVRRLFVIILRSGRMADELWRARLIARYGDYLQMTAAYRNSPEGKADAEAGDNGAWPPPGATMESAPPPDGHSFFTSFVRMGHVEVVRTVVRKWMDKNLGDLAIAIRHRVFSEVRLFDAVAPLANETFVAGKWTLDSPGKLPTAYSDLYMSDRHQNGCVNRCVDEHGNTLLTLAAQNGAKRCAQLLVHKGANPNHQNCKGQTSLHYAMAFGFCELGAWFVRPRNGPIITVSATGRLEWDSDTCGAGADDTIANVYGCTAYDGLRPLPTE